MHLALQILLMCNYFWTDDPAFNDNAVFWILLLLQNKDRIIFVDETIFHPPLLLSKFLPQLQGKDGGVGFLWIFPAPVILIVWNRSPWCFTLFKYCDQSRISCCNLLRNLCLKAFFKDSFILLASNKVKELSVKFFKFYTVVFQHNVKANLHDYPSDTG